MSGDLRLSRARWRRRRIAWGAAAVTAVIAAVAWSLAAPAASRPGLRPADVAVRSDALAACEAHLEAARDGRPAMAVAGASYTAGVGPGDAARSWAVLLARALGWNAVVDGVPGAGYVSAGNGGRGPVIRLLDREGLRPLAPALVIVQAGHDDARVPAQLEQRQVRQVIAMIRDAAPQARIALLTTFTAGPAPAALARTDEDIIAAARAADPNVIIMDPIGGRWRFQRVDNGLHPTAAGDAWIARKAAAILRAHGVLPATADRAPVVCYSGVRGRSVLRTAQY